MARVEKGGAEGRSSSSLVVALLGPAAVMREGGSTDPGEPSTSGSGRTGWDDHYRFPPDEWKYIGCAFLRSTRFQPLEEAERTENRGVPPSSPSYNLSIKLSKRTLRVIDPHEGWEILPASEDDDAFLASCRRVISNHWLFSAWRVDEGVARMDVYLSSSLWWEESSTVFDMKTHVRRVLGRLELKLAPDPQNARADEMLSSIGGGHGDGKILPRMFAMLPRHKDLVSKNFFLGQESSVLPNDRTTTGLWLLPGSALQKIVQSLDSATLGNLAATCRHLHSLCCVQVPGLKLQLYRHQKTALLWMLSREGNPRQMSLSPSAAKCATGDGCSFWVDRIGAKVAFTEPDTYTDCRGGFLCDEPGMGKTVTAISLVLRTISQLPAAPEGCVPIFSCEGSRQGFYETQKQESGGLAVVNTGVTKNRRSKRHRRGLQRPAPITAAATAGAKASGAGVLGHAQASSSASVPTAASAPTPFGNHTANPAGVGPNQTKEETDPADQIDWVQCDACKKWRVISKSMCLEKYAKWFCKMSSDPNLKKNGCSVPEDNLNGSSVDQLSTFKAQGYILQEDWGKKGRRSKEKSLRFEEDNIQFFISVLKIRKDLWSNVASAVNFLATYDGCQKQLLSRTGIHVPSGRREPEDYGTFFEKLGLARVPNTAHNWMQPDWIGGQMRFDQTALSLSISDLNEFKIQVEQIFLSSATLIVVPPHLIPQWKAQLDKCCERGHVKVYTYDEREKALEAHDMAWNFDVVLTTFNILSTDWAFHRENSSLMRIHWLRIILDEGHSLGSSLGITNKLQMACYIRAERRWIMTGTPTPEAVAQGANHLLPLLKFLHEPQFGLQPTKWQPCVQKPLEQGKVEGARSLIKLLARIMIHAQKSDLESIPKCDRETVKLDFDSVHAKNYNEFVAIVQKNLLLADWWDDSHRESLMHSSKLREMMTVIRNIRLSCNLSGHMKIDVYEEDIRETMMILTQMKPDIDPLKLAWIERGLRYGAKCERCHQFCRVPIVTPRCAHLLCVDCAGLNREACALCGKEYLMEPGQFSPEKLVPVELIELQPSYDQGGGGGDVFAPTWLTTGTAKSRFLLSRLASSSNKVIVFSQFQEHLRMIEDCIPQEYKCVGLYSSSLVLTGKKMKSLRAEAIQRFQDDEDCRVLLMDGICSHGLDLSFCSHIIVLEPIWDAALEEQVVSRAHRMGQRRQVLVETLAMRGTTEDDAIASPQLLKPPPTAREDTENKEEKNKKNKKKRAEKDDPESSEELRKSRVLLSGLKAVVGTSEGEDEGSVAVAANRMSKGLPAPTFREAPASSASVVDLAREVLEAAPPSGAPQPKPAAAMTNDSLDALPPAPPKKKVKFSIEEEDPVPSSLSPDHAILSALLAKYESLREVGMAAVDCALREERAETVARGYFLLVAAHWSSQKAAKDIYLLEKEKHPRYAAPRLWELAREFPDWFCNLLCNILNQV